MITIDQLLESVDLDFEPRWVTQNAFGVVAVRSGKKPHPESPKWIGEIREYQDFGKIKLAEFDGKDWTQCIYEVPRKTDKQNLEKLRPADSDLVYRVKLPRKTTGKIEKLPTSAPFGCQGDWREKINELVDAVNELKGKMNVV